MALSSLLTTFATTLPSRVVGQDLTTTSSGCFVLDAYRSIVLMRLPPQ